MKKQTQLLSALALSVGLTLSASFQAVASIPGQVADQAPLPSLAPMLEKVLPAVVSVRVEGTASQGQKIPEEFKKFFGDDLPDQPAQPFEGLGSGVIINANKGYVLTNNCSAAIFFAPKRDKFCTARRCQKDTFRTVQK